MPSYQRCPQSYPQNVGKLGFLITFSDKKITNLTFPFLPIFHSIYASSCGKSPSLPIFQNKKPGGGLTRRVKEKEKGRLGLFRDREELQVELVDAVAFRGQALHANVLLSFFADFAQSESQLLELLLGHRQSR